MAIKILSGIRENVTCNTLNLLFKQSAVKNFGFFNFKNNLNKSWLQRTADMFSDERLSVHNCHGLGQRQCVIDGYRTKRDLKMGNERTIFELNKAKEK